MIDCLSACRPSLSLFEAGLARLLIYDRRLRDGHSSEELPISPLWEQDWIHISHSQMETSQRDNTFVIHEIFLLMKRLVATIGESFIGTCRLARS